MRATLPRPAALPPALPSRCLPQRAALRAPPSIVGRAPARVGVSVSAMQPAAAAAAAAAPVKDSTPFTIVGAGRVGEALAAMGVNDTLIRRNEPIPATPAGSPILVATRNDALDAVVAATPAARRGDLVFLQNGMLQPWLQAKGLTDATQVLVYFAVAAKGDAPTDGVTDLNPEGLTAAHGRHADAVAARLRGAGLSCHVLDKQAFDACMLEKLVWICAFMLVGAKHGGITVGEVESKHTAEVDALIIELASAGAAALGGLHLGPNLPARLRAYARSVAHFPTAVKEFEWRNGWFWGASERAAAEGRADPTPLHTALLKEVGVV